MSASQDEASSQGPRIYGLSVEELARLAKQAVSEAIDETLAAGIPVTGEVDGCLVRLHPDGSIEPVEKASTSVYADLGYPNADQMERKAVLVTQLAVELRARKLNRRAAAALLSTQPEELEQILRGRFRAVSVEELSRMVQVLADALPARPGNSKVRHYSRRQRKRRHVGEFAQTGVDLRITFTRAVDWDAVIDELISLIHGLGLEGAGFGSSGPCVAIEGAVVFIGLRARAIPAFEHLAAALRAWPFVDAVEALAPWDGWWADPPGFSAVMPADTQRGPS